MAMNHWLEELNIRTLDEMHLAGERVLVRVDFNVPLDESGDVADDRRVVAALPTITAIQQQGGRVILCSHLGRPKGAKNDKLSMEPVARCLAELMDQDVLLPDDCVGDAANHLISNQRANQIVLLQNLRFHRGETSNSEEFARQLAALCDVYVNDAFGTLHRAHASVDALPRLMPDRSAGLLVSRELEFLSRLVTGTQSPFMAIIGGAKISDKIAMLERLLEQVDGLMIGGAMANTFLAAQGHEMGRSLVETDRTQMARHLLQRCVDKNISIFLPVDHVVVEEVAVDAATDVVERGHVGPTQRVVDIGPATVELYGQILLGQHDDVAMPRTVFWNGPMGVFEMEPFSRGTIDVARVLAQSSALSVVGGGDSAAAVRRAGVAEMVGHVSTGGGAALAYLGGEVLPGLAALRGGRR